ncbi:MAG TPA: GNAT family N-acetyltransferase [Vicinamibacterales bacterium]|nr:GNAT family N-acetyltransferase [Vicinamibacterales bacterium]
MPLQVVPAVGPVLDQILADTHPLWHDGLSLANYAKAWHAQLKTPWGMQHLDRVALIDGPHVLASAKRYDLSVRFDGRIRRVLGIGAVFTPDAHRGRGFARELITRMLDTAVTEGQEFAMLFSEISPAFYERLDFVPVPLIESTLEVDQKRGGAPAMLVRSGDDKDLPAIAEMSAARAVDARLALDRAEDFIRFNITRKRLQSGLAPLGTRHTEFLVVEEGHQAVAYLVSTEQDGRWMIEEAGDRDPAGARLGAMLQVMLARYPSERLPEIKCWWPRALVPPQVRVAAAIPTQSVLMIRPLRDRILPLPPLAAAEVVYWHADYF